MHTKIAKRSPFDQGAPRIQAPAIYGASPEKPILYRIPALGQRPMRFSAELPEGLRLSADGIITGSIDQTIANAARVGREGMRDTDLEILNIMLGK